MRANANSLVHPHPTERRFHRTGALMAVMAFCLSFANAKDFSVNEGRYRGTWRYLVQGQNFVTNVRGNADVSKRGTQLTLSLTGVVDVSGNLVPIISRHQFGPGRKLRANSPLLGYHGPATTIPTRFAGGSVMTAKLDIVPGTVIDNADASGTSLNYSFRFLKHRIVILGTGLIIANGNPTTVTFITKLKRQGP